MEFGGIICLAVLVAAIGAFAFGSIYYGSLGEPWKKPAMIDPAEAKMSPVLFITGFIAELIMA